MIHNFRMFETDNTEGTKRTDVFHTFETEYTEDCVQFYGRVCLVFSTRVGWVIVLLQYPNEIDI